MINRLIPPPALAAAALLLAPGCGRGGKTAPAAAPSPASPAAVRVKVMAARPRVFEARLVVQGGVEAESEAVVSARVPGAIDAVWVDEGDEVVAGETPLFQIDPVSLSNEVVVAEQALAVAKSSLAVSEANLESAEATARKAGLDFARYGRLHKEGRVTDNELETRETQDRQAKAGVGVVKAQIALARQQAGQAGARLAIARKNLRDSRVVAPLTGRVSLRSADPGEFVSAGEPVLKIVDVRRLEAAGFVPAAYYGRVRQGETAFRLAGAGGDDLGPVTVTCKSPVVDTTLRTFEIKGRLSEEQAAALAPGMMVAMTLVFDSRESLGVPSGAVLVRDGEDVVFVARDGRAVRRAVRTGYANDGMTEILSGLEPGEEVIREGHTLVRDGAPVEIAR